ncbi:MAG: hypothetical protein WD357_00160 [Gracilimonas sp.]
MSSSPLRILKNAIFEAKTWKPGRSRNTLENDFFQLMLKGPSLDEHNDLWDEFRKALSENPHLKEKELLEFLSRKDYAREGYWWFDPTEWK